MYSLSLVMCYNFLLNFAVIKKLGLIYINPSTFILNQWSGSSIMKMLRVKDQFMQPLKKLMSRESEGLKLLLLVAGPEHWKRFLNFPPVFFLPGLSPPGQSKILLYVLNKHIYIKYISLYINFTHPIKHIYLLGDSYLC